MRESISTNVQAPATFGTRLLKQRRLVNLAAVVLALGWIGVIMTTIAPKIDDFKFQWQASVNLMQSGSPYAATPGYERNRVQFHDPNTGARTLAYVYPPFLAYFLQPLALLDLEPAQWIWFGLNVLTLTVFLGVCIRVSGSTWAREFWGVVALVALIAPPTRLSLQLGQISIMLGLLIIASFALARRYPSLSGAFLALTTLIKLFPGFMGLYYLVSRRHRVIGWTVAAGLVIGALLLLSYGLTPYNAFLNIVLHDNYYPYSAEFNISVIGFWDRLFVPGPYARPLLDAPTLGRALSGIMALGLLGCCAAVQRKGYTELGRLLQFSVWICVMLLLTPANGYYNLVLLLLPCLVVLRFLQEHPDRMVRLWLALATALVCIPPAWSKPYPALFEALHTGWGLFVLTPPFYGMLLYIALLTKLARSQAVVQTTES